MPRNAIQPQGLARPKPPYSPVVVSGDHVFTAGQVAQDAEGNVVGDTIEEQTRQVLENLKVCLEAAGSSMDEVVKVLAFLTDLSDFPGYNAVYAEYFSEPYPARSSVGAALAPGFLVEIEAVARRAT